MKLFVMQLLYCGGNSIYAVYMRIRLHRYHLMIVDL
jgi:hypothetical protein